MGRLSRGVAALAALLMLAGCGATGAPAAAPQAKPKSEAAEFGVRLAGLLNDGKGKALYDLWSDDDGTKDILKDAVMPDAKPTGVRWSYKSGSTKGDEGVVRLTWTTRDRSTTRRFDLKRVDGEWRLTENPLVEADICTPFSVDGVDAPVVGNVTGNKSNNGMSALPEGEWGPCTDPMGIALNGEALLLVPGEHKVSLGVFDGVIEQPYTAMAYPGDWTSVDFSEKPGRRNLVSATMPKPAAGYAAKARQAFKEGLVTEEGFTGPIKHRPILDGVTLTPTDDPLKPDIGGTYQHWINGLGPYETKDASELSWDAFLNTNGFGFRVSDTCKD